MNVSFSLYCSLLDRQTDHLEHYLHHVLGRGNHLRGTRSTGHLQGHQFYPLEAAVRLAVTLDHIPQHLRPMVHHLLHLVEVGEVVVDTGYQAEGIHLVIRHVKLEEIIDLVVMTASEKTERETSSSNLHNWQLLLPIHPQLLLPKEVEEVKRILISDTKRVLREQQTNKSFYVFYKQY